MTRPFSTGTTRDPKMASLDRNVPRVTRSRLAAMALIMMASAVSGCAGSRDGMTTSAISDDYRQRHPIVLTEKEHHLDIPVSAEDRRLPIGTRDTVRGFVQDYRAHASGTVEILTAEGSANTPATSTLRRQIRQELVASGIPSARIVDSYYPAAGPRDAAPIRLSFTATTAVTNACGQWPDDLADNAFDNQNYYNFGCATQNNLAAQVANPTDLIAPRAMSPIDTDQRSKVIDNYRSGNVPTSTSTIDLGTGGAGF
jgi:pilus assembly protein CpaD